MEAKLLRTPSVSLPPRERPVIQMGLPDTSHVQDHPLNGRRGRGRGRNSNRGRGNRHRGRGNGRRVSYDADFGEESRNEVTGVSTILRLS